ncbi:phage holin family protein [Allonocardiopsis opalescens]|uniref:Putative membrane protein n=1 Tax=Allonocardiopsis opalescens TaxID=1144618 RepID=A0A2T0QFB5_9ACTN|nr:phage holin family protein [Allonocardiopsis opalescens]PRY02624.1 putative membrane protein [Allonocardiopsis opalescens]
MSILIRVIVNALALWLATVLVGGLEVTTDSVGEQVVTLVVVAVIFGIVNAVIKPIVKTVGCPVYVLTLGLIALVVNALLLLLTGWLAGQFGLAFEVDGFWAAFWGAIIVGIVSWLANMFVGRDSD